MMNLFTGSGVGPTILYLALSIFIGLLLGKIKIANVYTGAITNTPGLSAAQQAVNDIGMEGAADRLAAGYAVAYPLAVVGLSAGGQFVATVQEHYMWVVYGVIITMVPPILVGLIGRLVLKMNYYTLMGFIGGSHTDPPTLAFANTVAPEGCKLPNMGYATVYPLTMFLRIFTAQLLVLLAV